MAARVGGFLKALGRRIRGHFIAGILVSVPLGLTVWILVWAFEGIDGFFGQYLEEIFNRRLPGVGFGITVLLVYLVGFLASNILGRRLGRYAESVVAGVPIINYIYGGIRQIIRSFTTPGGTGHMQVVLVEFPRKGTRTIGFVTNVLSAQSGHRLINVFIPTCPNPTLGFLEIVKEEDIIYTDLSVDDALKMVVSGGRLTPPEVGERLGAAARSSLPPTAPQK